MAIGRKYKDKEGRVFTIKSMRTYQTEASLHFGNNRFDGTLYTIVFDDGDTNEISPAILKQCKEQQNET